MHAWLNSLRRDQRGVAVVEFALVVPIWLLLFSGMLEIGRAYYQTDTLEKAVRAGALYAARHPLPLNATTLTEAENLVRTGTVDGSGNYLISGWSKAGNDLEITTHDYAIDSTTSVPVVRVVAKVPFDPLLPGLPSFVGLGTFTMSAVNEQAYVGD